MGLAARIAAMNSQAFLARISQELVAAHGAHTILLYGSHADGSAGPDSDYDIAGFAPVAQPLRIARVDAVAALVERVVGPRQT
jgi:predicted nucleotidyltransferase